MPEAKHTPVPYKWDEPSNWHGLSARIYHENEGRYEPIATVQLSGWPRRVGLANAAFLVRAANSHEQLLEACRIALDNLTNIYGCPNGATASMLRAAIAAAEAK